MTWIRMARRVDEKGTTIYYKSPGTDLTIESRKRHIPHANGSGTWDLTTYHVLKSGKELVAKYRLADAKKYAEGVQV